MRFTSEASSDGVCEQLFTLGEIPGVLWTPEGAAGTRPLIVMGHGGGEHKAERDGLRRTLAETEKNLLAAREAGKRILREVNRNRWTSLQPGACTLARLDETLASRLRGPSGQREAPAAAFQ
jgi:hypothetical protein